MKKTAVITGASSGIGRAAAVQFAKAGYRVIIGARRMERLQQLADEVDAHAIALDVTDPESSEEFAAAVDRCDVLVNSAGGALGMESVEELDEDKWRWMYEANVLGFARLTKALLPKLRESGDGVVVTITSTAAHTAYPGGGGYTAAKYAARAVVETLRLELLGEPVRVVEVAPGAVETEFSVVGFAGGRSGERVLKE